MSSGNNTPDPLGSRSWNEPKKFSASKEVGARTLNDYPLTMEFNLYVDQCLSEFLQT